MSGVCTIPTCGDGVVDLGEQCDDGEANADAPDACRTSCRVARCGDGIVDRNEQCDRSDVEGGVCMPSCFVACAPRGADVDADRANGCEATAIKVEDSLAAADIVVDRFGIAYWNNVSTIFALDPERTEPDFLIADGPVDAIAVGADLLAWSQGFDVFVMELFKFEETQLFDLLGNPDCTSLPGGIPDTFAECIEPFVVDLEVISNLEVLLLDARFLLWRHINVPKSTRVLFQPDADLPEAQTKTELTHVALSRGLAYVATRDGRIFVVTLDKSSPPREVVRGQLPITAMTADDTALVWVNAVNGDVAVLDVETEDLVVLPGGDAPVAAVALTPEMIILAADAGTSDPGRVFVMKRDGSARRVLAGTHDKPVGVAAFEDDVYWVDAEAVVENPDGIVSGAHRVSNVVLP